MDALRTPCFGSKFSLTGAAWLFQRSHPSCVIWHSDRNPGVSFFLSQVTIIVIEEPCLISLKAAPKTTSSSSRFLCYFTTNRVEKKKQKPAELEMYVWAHRSYTARLLLQHSSTKAASLCLLPSLVSLLHITDAP